MTHCPPNTHPAWTGESGSWNSCLLLETHSENSTGGLRGSRPRPQPRPQHTHAPHCCCPPPGECAGPYPQACLLCVCPTHAPHAESFPSQGAPESGVLRPQGRLPCEHVSRERGTWRDPQPNSLEPSRASLVNSHPWETELKAKWEKNTSHGQSTRRTLGGAAPRYPPCHPPTNTGRPPWDPKIPMSAKPLPRRLESEN